jgi:hypothetical protein
MVVLKFKALLILILNYKKKQWVIFCSQFSNFTKKVNLLKIKVFSIQKAPWQRRSFASLMWLQGNVQEI